MALAPKKRAKKGIKSLANFIKKLKKVIDFKKRAT